MGRHGQTNEPRGIALRSVCPWAVPASPEPVNAMPATSSSAAIKMDNLTHPPADGSRRAAAFVNNLCFLRLPDFRVDG